MVLKHIQNIIKENIIIILIFSILLLITILFFENSKQTKIDDHLTFLKQQYNSQYKTIYNNFDRLAQNTFYGIINKEDIYNNIKYAYKKDSKTQAFYRTKLYNLFTSDYSRLTSFNFKQIHFHFPDNTSFLRMHKPNTFGDNLSNIRYSVVKVNQTLKPVTGFEIGRIVHGFRYVFPLHDKNLYHIGSVETSVASSFFENYFEDTYNVDAHFLIKKSIVDAKVFQREIPKQILSVENDEYYITTEKKEEKFHFNTNNFYFTEELQSIQTKMNNGENFNLIKKMNFDYIVVNFIPIANIEGMNNSAYIVLYKKSQIIQQIYYSYYKLLAITFLLTIVFMFLIHLKYNKDQTNKQKDHILSQQSKMASMGEMIGNIAHQWRQPLSVISTAASGIKLQKEYNLLTDEMFFESVDKITESTVYLSQTIEDFRNYFNNNKQKSSFNIADVIKKSISIFGSSFQLHNIQIVKNLQDITITSFENELKQVLINLLKNSKDAIGKDGTILIDTKLNGDIITISIQDSGGGIPKDVLPRIFEPYFTTKHQSVGTGLGLFMSFEIVNKSLNGNIKVKNNSFAYEFKNYTGALFTIELNKAKLQ